MLAGISDYNSPSGSKLGKTRGLCFRLPTPTAGAGASELGECSIERRLVTESGLEGDLYKRCIGVEKELFSVIDSLIDNPAVNRKSEGLLE